MSEHPDKTSQSPSAHGRTGNPRRNGHYSSKLTRAFAYSLFILLLIAILSLWQRDRQIIRYWQNRMENQFAQILRDSTNQWGQLPLQFPFNEVPGNTRLESMYPPLEEIRALRHFDGPVIVGISSRVNRLLGRDGYFIVLYSSGEYTTQWVNATQLAQQYQKQHDWVEQWYNR